MEKGSVSLITLILLLIGILIVGLILGYIVGTNNGNSQENSKVQEERSTIDYLSDILNTDEAQGQQAVENNAVTTNEQVKYDGSKSITIKEKTYNISYISEKYEADKNYYNGHTELKLYSNNKKVATVNLGCIEDIKHEYGTYGYDVSLYNICENYIAIQIKTNLNDGESEVYKYAYICVINTEGQLIDTFQWSNEQYVSDKETGKELTYKIENDGITMYDVYYNEYEKTSKAIELKYSVVRDYITKTTGTTYNVLVSGK